MFFFFLWAFLVPNKKKAAEITPYIDFHPGGKRQIMQGVGAPDLGSCGSVLIAVLVLQLLFMTTFYLSQLHHIVVIIGTLLHRFHLLRLRFDGSASLFQNDRLGKT